MVIKKALKKCYQVVFLSMFANTKQQQYIKSPSPCRTQKQDRMKAQRFAESSQGGAIFLIEI